jgi:hypothetical protein
VAYVVPVSTAAKTTCQGVMTGFGRTGAWFAVNHCCGTGQLRPDTCLYDGMATVDQAHGGRARGAIIDRASGVPIGGTRYLALRAEHHGLKIGWMWLG